MVICLGGDGLLQVDDRFVAHQPHAVTNTLPAGAFPRDVTVTANGTLALVPNFDSDQLETVRLMNL